MACQTNTATTLVARVTAVARVPAYAKTLVWQNAKPMDVVARVLGHVMMLVLVNVQGLQK